MKPAESNASFTSVAGTGSQVLRLFRALLLTVAGMLLVASPEPSFAQGRVKKFVTVTSEVCDGAFSWTDKASALDDLKTQCLKSTANKRNELSNQVGKAFFWGGEVGWAESPQYTTRKGPNNETRYKAQQGSFTVRYYYYADR